MQWHDQQKFQEEFSCFMLVSLQRGEQLLVSDASVKPERKDQRISRLRELAAAWAPLDREIFLRGITDPHGKPY
eukprot:3721975-Pyramimonas_sp.AAC.1